jgi:toxin-antitoxin system PIN domain toxin
MKMPDVNVLVYAHRTDYPEHERYSLFLEHLMNGPEPVALSELVLSGFVRVTTHARSLKPPTRIELAWEFVSEMADHSNARLIRPGLEHWRIFRDLCQKTKATGKLVADAYHAAVAIEHGCEWLTTDSDFSRFSNLRTRHPLA